MPEFNTETEDIYMEDYPVSMLPEHITTSNHFKDWRVLFPDEIIFPILKDTFVETLGIWSQERLDKIINAEHEYGFTPTIKKAIFKEIESYWNDNPNSAPIKLPKRDKSWFGNQVRLLFKEPDEMAIISCMKLGYLDLFNYIYEKRGSHILQCNGIFNIYPLIYYAIVNNHVNMLRRGIELGCPITDSLIKPTIERKNTEIFQILLDNNITINAKDERDICEFATPEMFKMFLEFYIHKANKDPANLIVLSIKNINNLKELLLTRNISTAQTLERKFAYKLMKECISYSVDIDTFLFIEQHFAVPLKEFKEYNEENGFEYLRTNYIPDSVIWNDNLGLYTCLHNFGFWAHDNLLYVSIKQRCHRITPGLLKTHIGQDRPFTVSQNNN
jgi:hypothetical protein